MSSTPSALIRPLTCPLCTIGGATQRLDPPNPPEPEWFGVWTCHNCHVEFAIRNRPCDCNCGVDNPCFRGAPPPTTQTHKYAAPTVCPFCGGYRCLEWCHYPAEWRCRCCRACFAVRGYPPPPQVDPSPAERTDLIAQAYRGRLSCHQALVLAECFVGRARRVMNTGRPEKRETPLDFTHHRVAGGNTSKLEITP